MDNLFIKKEKGWNDLENEKIFEFSNYYIDFLNESKTERKFIANAIDKLKKAGFVDVKNLKLINKGDKIYFNNRNKCLYALIVGDEDINNGLNIIGSHVDSPRLDLKSNPLYEDAGFAYFKTDYYGGIKKYQWVSIPLTLEGVIVKTNGEIVDISIGNENEDPIFTITDLLPHLAKNQMTKTLKEGIDAEHLNVIIGNMESGNDKEKVKANIMKILNKKYGITEYDFHSAELELIPAFNAKSLGFDYSLIAGYGQDDRVCAYCSLEAMVKLDKVKRTAVCIFSDKEEVGSNGNTGMQSLTFTYFLSTVLNKMNINKPNLIDEIYNNSKMLSTDVEAAYDPSFDSAFEKNNVSHLSHGISITKYTGGAGKSSGSDANAEFLAQIRYLLEKNKLKYQMSKLGRAELGGGGTIAYILANKGIEVVDCGVSILSMHSPYEIVSKFDIYELYKFNKIFWES